MEKKIVKLGNSYGVILPSKFFKELGLTPDSIVNVEFDTLLNAIIIKNIETASHNDLEQVIKDAVDKYLKEKGY